MLTLPQPHYTWKVGDWSFSDLRSSTFCLCPSGWGWGWRTYLALAALCVPVIVQPLVEQAFHELLPYEKFSLFVPANELKRAPLPRTHARTHTHTCSCLLKISLSVCVSLPHSHPQACQSCYAGCLSAQCANFARMQHAIIAPSCGRSQMGCRTKCSNFRFATVRQGCTSASTLQSQFPHGRHALS